MIKQALKDMRPIIPHGLMPIKVLELAKKWRPSVPEDYCDDLCPLLKRSTIEYVSHINKNNDTNESKVVEDKGETYSIGLQNESKETDLPQSKDHNQSESNVNEKTPVCELPTNHVAQQSGTQQLCGP